jgi:hypothetical protein
LISSVVANESFSTSFSLGLFKVLCASQYLAYNGTVIEGI